MILRYEVVVNIENCFSLLQDLISTMQNEIQQEADFGKIVDEVELNVSKLSNTIQNALVNGTLQELNVIKKSICFNSIL